MFLGLCCFKENVSCKHHSVFVKYSEMMHSWHSQILMFSYLLQKAQTATKSQWASPALLMVLVCTDIQHICFSLHENNKIKNQTTVKNEMHFPEFPMHIETKTAILFHLNYHFRQKPSTALQFLKFLYLIKHRRTVVSSQWFHHMLLQKKSSNNYEFVLKYFIGIKWLLDRINIYIFFWTNNWCSG